MYQTIVTTIVTMYTNGTFISANDQLPNSFKFPSSKDYPMYIGSFTCNFNGGAGVNYCYVIPGDPNLVTITNCNEEHNDGQPVRSVTISNSQVLIALSGTSVFSQSAIDCALQIQRTNANILEFDVLGSNFDDNYPITTSPLIFFVADLGDEASIAPSLSSMAIGFISAACVLVVIGAAVLAYFLYSRKSKLANDTFVNMTTMDAADK